jgi:cysteinyl-tRNA synthetase
MRRSVFILVSLLSALALSANANSQDPRDLLSVKNWAYFITNTNPKQVSLSNFDLCVVDYSEDGTDLKAFSPDLVAKMQHKTDGSRRILLCYLSIGEAEDYRFYWKSSWNRNPPTWLDKENPKWKGNYKVRYWEEGWQRIIYGTPQSYLDRIIAAGFDGVYLDIIDAFEYYQETRPSAPEEMIRFVTDLSGYAKKKKGTDPFFVFVQNGESLLENPQFLEAIDGVAKEDLFYGYEEEEEPRP